jgi:hypothetical protein
MATLREYYEKDGSRTLNIGRPIHLTTPTGEILLEVPSRLHVDLESAALYISFYIPASDHVKHAASILLNSIGNVLGWLDDLEIHGGFVGEQPLRARDARFTGRIYIYSEDSIEPEERNFIEEQAKKLGHSVQFRLEDYAQERSRLERPLAFISHDSRDKESIAKPLALELQKLQCPVWYDEFSLTVGESLRYSIEKGLRECRKCIFVVTPNFLSNGGWAKREYDSIFTRELVERQNVILPVWNDVTSQAVYEYSPILADRKAAQWTDGTEQVARQLLRGIGA